MGATERLWNTAVNDVAPLLSSTWGIGALAVLVTSGLLVSTRSRSDKPPIINEKSGWELSDDKTRLDFMMRGREYFDRGVERYTHKPFRLHTDAGLMTILPPEMANEIRNDGRLDFALHILKAMMASYPGFEGFNNNGTHFDISLDVINGKLTSAISRIAAPLSDECTMALEDIYGLDQEWKTVCLKETMLQLIARLSSRVFLGKELCRDPRWLDITIDYTINGFMAADELRKWPPILRPAVHWFLPRCRKLRAQLDEAYTLINAVIDKRKGSEETFDDTIAWYQTLSKGREYEPARAQLILSSAAIHTTTDLISQTLLDLAEHPEYIDALRKEISEVIPVEGWTKNAVTELKLLDSVIKESQRLKPISFVAMRREATEKVVLSDGTVIDKGDTVGVSSQRMWDPEVYPDPMKWDGYRFMKMRSQPGCANTCQLVTTHPDHLAFGHGKHACPGRFFAADEIKIALIHFLTHYDIRPAPGSEFKVLTLGVNMNVDPFAKVEIRRRDDNILQ